MSLRPTTARPVPEETAQVARAAFPRGNLLMSLRDELGPVFDDQRFAPLFPARGQPAEAPWRLAMVTLLQFAERLSDRQAADAVRGRIDWKYLLALPLADPGFDSTVLSEFRARLVAGGAERLLLEAVLAVAAKRRLIRSGGRQRTDSTHVLAAVRALNRIECVAETLRHALDVLAAAAPDWLLAHTLPHWAEAYGRRAFDDRLPRSAAQREARARAIGEDGHHLLAAAFAPEAPAWLRAIPAVQVLRQVWVQQFYLAEGEVRWREAEGIPPAARFISSPHDTEAHYARKHTTSWIGYKVHLTETCDAGLPRIVTHVQTVSAPIADGEATTPAHRALRRKGLLPAQHLVDTGYLDAALLVETRRDFGVDLVGPTRGDRRWQAQAGKGFAAEAFAVDWEAQRVTCPSGARSASWTPAVDNRGAAVVKVKFSPADCGRCIHRADCAGPQARRRLMTLRGTRDEHAALQAARRRERTPEFAALYALRAGVEATISQAVRAFGLRRSRYFGLAKTHLQHVATAAAMNLARIAHWVIGDPLAPTRRSRFARLLQTAAPA